MSGTTVDILVGDCRKILADLPAGSAQCCVTSPPYFGLRDYGMVEQAGLEATPAEYVAGMVGIFREVRRVLADDGTLWLNIGDSYHNYRSHLGGSVPTNSVHRGGSRDQQKVEQFKRANRGKRLPGLKDKDLIGIPWMLAFALRDDGWWLRSPIIWAKPNPMVERVRDRPTSAYEMVFLLAKAGSYFYDADALDETAPDGTLRNARNIWSIPTQSAGGGIHFATMPPELAARCIRAGSRSGDTVLDPFGGCGTTGLTASRLGRCATVIELNPAFAALARNRIDGDAPLLTRAM
jgi:DNA modification methylase